MGSVKQGKLSIRFSNKQIFTVVDSSYNLWILLRMQYLICHLHKFELLFSSIFGLHNLFI